jgi:hypothetical protein
MLCRGAELSPYAPRGFEEKNDYPKLNMQTENQVNRTFLTAIEYILVTS